MPEYPKRSIHTLIALGIVAALATGCQDDRTANMSCEDLRLDNLEVSEIYPPTDESMQRARENNERVAELDCAWTKDDKAGPAD